MGRLLIAICLITIYPIFKDGLKAVILDFTRITAFALKHTIGKWRNQKSKTTRNS